MKINAQTSGALAIAFSMLAASASAQDVIRHAIPDSDFPISRAVEIPADATVVYLSGAVPSVIDDAAEPGSAEAYGDTEAQTVSVLEAIEGTLGDLDLTMGDVYKMQVYLVAPEEGAAMDFGGFMDGYTQFFGTDAQPNLPVRSVFEVAGLANPAWLVEIEVTAVRPPE
ncbi:MAG: RidA family protein [Rhodobacterales bacterium]